MRRAASLVRWTLPNACRLLHLASRTCNGKAVPNLIPVVGLVLMGASGSGWSTQSKVSAEDSPPTRRTKNPAVLIELLEAEKSSVVPGFFLSAISEHVAFVDRVGESQGWGRDCKAMVKKQFLAWAKRTAWQEETDKGAMWWVAKHGGHVVGLVGLHSDALSQPDCHDLRIAELRRLYVQESFQGRGVGRQLVETAIAEARRQGHDVLYLLTDHYGMEIAAKLYQDGRLGFGV
ncbi:unnamed protein product [Symbiodinium natans]|uniref:N-acetyltransferase domain-containing protein n=1 Tax=Symbiodinium natans TaxID=878477 RepID=A0A812M8X5_9DINO|nr:unnamed protein product [Symbiodinium natans]